MTVNQQDDHIFLLWKRLYSKLRGALKIVNIFGDMAMEINVFGQENKTKELSKLE
jgi:hypothetical protein